MKICTILDHIDSGHMALPEFQRGYVWNRDQVRKLFTSLTFAVRLGAFSFGPRNLARPDIGGMACCLQVW